MTKQPQPNNNNKQQRKTTTQNKRRRRASSSETSNPERHQTQQKHHPSRRRYLVAQHHSSFTLVLFIVSIFHFLSLPLCTNSTTISGRPIKSAESSSSVASMAPKFTPEERAQLREAFLRKFGLDQIVPPPGAMKKRAAGARPTAATVQIPDYIWELYEAHSTASPSRAADVPQIIRHYGPMSVQLVMMTTDNRIAAQAWLAFNLSAAGRQPEKEEVVRAELRLPDWKMPPNGSLSVSHRNKDHHNDEEAGLIPTTSIKEWTRPWIDLDAQMFANRVNNVDAEDDARDQLHLTLHLPADIGQEEANRMLKTAALIVYSNERKDGQYQNGGGKEEDQQQKGEQRSRQRRRTKRQAGSSGESGERNGSGSSSGRQKRGNNRSGEGRSSSSSGRTGMAGGGAGSAAMHHRHHHRQHSAGMCRRAGLYVDFAELNWQDWILQPTGYEAYQCKGRCIHPMPASLNSTNHAVIQSLIHSIDPAAAPAPNCVPVEMSPLSILYRDPNKVIIVKSYEEMRVETCGCH